LTSLQASVFSSAQVQALIGDDLRALRTSAFAALGSAAVAAISTQAFVALTSAQMTALTTQQTQALTSAQVEAFTTAQVLGLETRDLAVMTPNQVAAFTTTAVGVMTMPQIEALLAATPLMLDLNGNGIQTSSAAQGVHFDLVGTGTQAKWGWAAGGDGLLVRDRNHDGIINNGSELYGMATLRADGSRAGNGFVALALEDSNHDGVVDRHDAHWKELQVWVDANHDGLTDKGELHSLDALGVVSLDVNARPGSELNNGNLLGLVSQFTTADGARHDLVDVWFVKDTTAQTPPPSAPVALTEVLVAPAAEVLPSSTGAPPGHAVPSSLLIERRHGLDDEQRQMPLI